MRAPTRALSENSLHMTLFHPWLLGTVAQIKATRDEHRELAEAVRDGDVATLNRWVRDLPAA